MSCPACFSGSEHDGTPKGKVIKLHGLDTYVTEPPEGRPAKGIIVIIPDAFGIEFINNKILADIYAAKGDYKVYLPDFMLGMYSLCHNLHSGGRPHAHVSNQAIRARRGSWPTWPAS